MSHDHKKLSEYFGPGTWATFHSESLPDNVKKRRERINCLNMVIRRTRDFECKVCSEHGLAWLAETSDRRKVIVNNGKDPWALFDYLVEFHNHASRNAGKKEMGIWEAREMWSKKNFADCGECMIEGKDSIMF